jgi:hypothetical protein
MKLLTELLAAVVAAALAIIIVQTALGHQAVGVKILIVVLVSAAFLAVFERVKATRIRQ